MKAKRIQQHIEAFNDGKAGYTCEQCGKRYRTRERLRHHTIAHHTKEYPFHCDECTFKCCSRTAINDHKEIHEFKRKKEQGTEVSF